MSQTPPLQPSTSSLNNPEYQALPAGGADVAAAVPDDTGSARGGTPRPSPRSRPDRGDARNYTLITAPNYDTIVGGEAPSPFVSLILLIGLGGLVGAAVANALGFYGLEWWLGGTLFVVIATLLAGFISRSA